MRPLTRRILLVVASIYVLLLLFSHIVRRTAPERAPRASDPATFTIRQGSEDVAMAWRTWPQAEAESSIEALKSISGENVTSLLPMILLHGSPGDSTNFNRLAPLLSERADVLAPDLLGFGFSSRDAPDVSMRAQADALLELLDSQGIEKAHMVGFSLGGGAALDFAELAPERVASITLLSAIGAQEYELLGSYEINHAIHALQLSAIRFLEEGVPHFGSLDGMMLDQGYARSFYETDQRKYREILSRLEVPLLILHGREDFLVPVEAALEHHRLAPQSELVLFDASHFMVFRTPQQLTSALFDFFRRTEAGAARLRSTAESERIVRAEEPFDPSTLPAAQGVTVLVWMLLLGGATLISEDLATISAGLLVGQGRLGWSAGIFACFAGIMFGDILLFLVGRWLGRPWMHRAPLKYFLDEAKIEKASQWLDQRGPAVILLSRFTPGMRLPTYVAAGMLNTGFWRFTLWFAIAVGLWVPALIAFSAGVGTPLLAKLQEHDLHPALAFLALAITLWTLVGLVQSLSTHKRRRLSVGRWKRRLQWEYWPRWAFYPPIVLWILLLGIRRRGLTLFTLANPAMPDGGFVGESKSDILSKLPQDVVARWRLIPATLDFAAKRHLVEEFVEDLGKGLPIVLKPDIGERGDGVTIARTWESVASTLQTDTDLIVQEFIQGPELGILWTCLPDADRGNIFSVAEKRLIYVEGDGSSTLEDLILKDSRAVAMAPVFLQRHQDRLETIPAAGERVRLVDVGTHCRGALFLDGFSHLTPELEEAVQRASLAFEGFYLGRYDLRATSWEAFHAGQFKVLELNGVTSEPAHIYDPKYGVFHAWRTVCQQWSLAFKIGAAMRAKGLKPTTIYELFRRVRGR